MKIKLIDSDDELYGIMQIQSDNHMDNLSNESMVNKGYVTVRHSIKMLKIMNQMVPQVIAKDAGVVIGYALVMPKELKNLIPVLIPMFRTFETMQYQGQFISDLNFYVMGQICIKDEYKRMGIFYKLYAKHKEEYSKKYDYCITEVDSNNIPSMIAHQKVGFKIIHQFSDNTADWNILLWDWK